MEKTIRTYIKPDEVANEIVKMFDMSTLDIRVVDGVGNFQEYIFQVEDMAVCINETGIYGQFHPCSPRTVIYWASELNDIDPWEVRNKIKSVIDSVFNREEALPGTMKRGMFFYGDGGVVSYDELVDDYANQLLNYPKYTDLTFRQWLEEGNMGYLPKIATTI